MEHVLQLNTYYSSLYQQASLIRSAGSGVNPMFQMAPYVDCHAKIAWEYLYVSTQRFNWRFFFRLSKLERVYAYPADIEFLGSHRRQKLSYLPVNLRLTFPCL